MKEKDEKIPNPKELEKEIGEFLTKKFGNNVKLVSPTVLPQESFYGNEGEPPKKKKKIDFDLKPQDLVAHLDQFMVKQDEAKAILATKICTHFNRIQYREKFPENVDDMVGSIKNNVLMIGPTGVGKTYMIKLIANKIGVPFVKGDATKFSETGYVGGDVEDLVRDLVREADDDIELAQYGIIYIDEIDKIASSRNLIGADVSRTGVQRALLKPMEETDVDLKVPHDPISMIQEIERFRKTGARENRTVNTKNILFIMSGAFFDLANIIKKRVSEKVIGFGAPIARHDEANGMLKHVMSEDLIAYGFESEFVGRLPVRAVFERLTEKDLSDILKNPNNPIILGKKLDFSAYGIDVKFADQALRGLAKNAFNENTGARGLVSAVESALLLFEKTLPSTQMTVFPVTGEVIENPQRALDVMLSPDGHKTVQQDFDRLSREEIGFVKAYIETNRKNLTDKYSLTLTASRVDIIADFYIRHIMTIEKVIKKIKAFYDEIKSIELYFFKSQDINIVLEEDAIDHIIEKFIIHKISFEDFYNRFASQFEHGLKLVREKTGKNRYFITREALRDPENYISGLLTQPELLKKTDDSDLPAH